MIASKFGDRDQFLNKVNPSVQSMFAAKPERSVMGDYPTLADICLTYGKTFAEQWLYPQLTDLSTFTGAKNMTADMIEKLAAVIATEYFYLKVTELLLFFHRFKAGHYGRFYGTVDPMVITCALVDFVKERNEFIVKYIETQEKLNAELQPKLPTMSYEQWLEEKKQKELENLTP